MGGTCLFVEGVRRLREELDEGLDGYRHLVAAASSSAGPKQELTEATDHLAGLAVALRELSEYAASTPPTDVGVFTGLGG